MWVLSHARLVYKGGANIQMGHASYVRDVEKWVSNYWEEDPLGAPPGIPSLPFSGLGSPGGSQDSLDLEC